MLSRIFGRVRQPAPQPETTPARIIRADRRRAEQLGREWKQRRDAMTAQLRAELARNEPSTPD